tara:strand:+ start:303 stop:917 length:615 start_codon:yes stop_codon:yes gene_type:complete
METKVCTKCGVEKKLTDFNKMSKVKCGVRSYCRECQTIDSKKYRIENKVKIKEYNTKWNEENQEYYKKYFEEYYIINYETEKERKLKWYRDNLEYFNNYQKKRKKEDIMFKLKTDMRNSVNRYLKYRSQKTFDIVGCDPQFLKEHLENQFTDGMGWDNRSEWHIDHIIPLSSAKTEDEIYKLCHYTNLQPLWAEDNLKKSNKIL